MRGSLENLFRTESVGKDHLAHPHTHTHTHRHTHTDTHTQMDTQHRSECSRAEYESNRNSVRKDSGTSTDQICPTSEVSVKHLPLRKGSALQQDYFEKDLVATSE